MDKRTPDPSLRLAALREDIASRLRRVCDGWPEERFEALVDHIATTTLKYEGKGGGTIYHSQFTDALVKRLTDGLNQSEELRSRLPGLAQGLGSIPRPGPKGSIPPRRGSGR